jgi:hypothetical protein
MEKGDLGLASKYVDGIAHTEEGKSFTKEIQNMKLFSRPYEDD